MFEPLNGLEQKLIAAATNPDARPAFISALLEADLYVSPGGPAPAEGLGQIVTSHEADGWAAAVFTAPERIAEVVRAGAPVQGFKGRALLELLRGKGLVRLNPNLDYGVLWSAEDVASILDGFVTTVIDRPTPALIGRPADAPADLIERLKREFGTDPRVKEAYLVLMHRQGEANPTLFLGVSSEGPWPSVQDLVRRAVDGYDFKNRFLDVGPLEGTLAGSLRTGIPIITPRRKRGFFDFLKG